MPAMESETYDPRYVEGIERFNRQEFFEAHEVWEQVWLEQEPPAKNFYKGLIQVAVGLHHFRKGNTRGIRKLYFSSRKYLQEFLPEFQGIDVGQLLSDMDSCCREVANSQEEVPTGKFAPERAPVLELERG
jgi:predicted metal-dependent hydrolase